MQEAQKSPKTKLTLFWGGFRSWSFRYVGGLIMESKEGGERVVSIGRCLLIAIVAWMFFYWAVWVGAPPMTAEAVAQLILDHLPEGHPANAVDVLTASRQVVAALPSGAPPLMETAFLTICAYVFGSKITGVVRNRLAK